MTAGSTGSLAVTGGLEVVEAGVPNAAKRASRSSSS